MGMVQDPADVTYTHKTGFTNVGFYDLPSLPLKAVIAFWVLAQEFVNVMLEPKLNCQLHLVLGLLQSA